MDSDKKIIGEVDIVAGKKGHMGYAVGNSEDYLYKSADHIVDGQELVKQDVYNKAATKYDKLINYFIQWGKDDYYLQSILNEERYRQDMADKCIPDELKVEIREAREQYLEYIGGEKMTHKHCVGCYENFYNSGDKTCWHFDKNKVLQTKYYIDNNASMGYKNNYRAMKVPPCYRKQGGVLVDKIPMEAK